MQDLQQIIQREESARIPRLWTYKRRTLCVYCVWQGVRWQNQSDTPSGYALN